MQKIVRSTSLEKKNWYVLSLRQKNRTFKKSCVQKIVLSNSVREKKLCVLSSLYKKKLIHSNSLIQKKWYVSLPNKKKSYVLTPREKKSVLSPDTKKKMVRSNSLTQKKTEENRTFFLNTIYKDKNNISHS